MLFFACNNTDITVLNKITPGRILVPASLGLYIADQLPPGMTISGLSFHRGSPAIKRSLEALVLPDARARKDAMTPFDYLAVCRINLPDSIPNTTLFAQLTRGEKWPGLEPIETTKASGILLFHIDHARLQ
jgi:hypothetical protein